MTLPRSAADILQDIQFEILQGLVDKDDLAPALHAVRQFQNQARRQTFERVPLADARRELFSRQFQFIDMLLNLLEALVLRLQGMQAEIAALRRAPQEMISSPAGSPPPQVMPSVPSALGGEALSPEEIASPLHFRPADEIEYAIRPETIHVDLQARPFHIPVIGWLLTKARIFYQRPALFYTQLFANRQAPVNRVLGDRILYLEELVAAQQRQIQALQDTLKGTPPEGEN